MLVIHIRVELQPMHLGTLIQVACGFGSCFALVIKILDSELV